MKKQLARISIFLGAFTVALLGGCSGGDEYNEEIFATPLTDDLKLTADFANKTFTDPTDNNNAIGEVTLTAAIDGDTVNFVNGRVDASQTSETSKPLRFLGINTPESTARVEPWGVKASKYVKSILWDTKNNKQKVYSVVLQNDYSVWGVKEGNDRYLGFLWYKVNEDSPYRLLNLEIIEQCYSVSQLHEYSDFCPYLDYFDQAYMNARKSGRRVNGERDPGYDYSNTITDVTVRDIREDYENFGISEDSGTAGSGIRLRVTGLILQFSGDNIVIRDVKNPYPNGEYASIYVFSSLTVKDMSSKFEVGEVITFVCRATTHNGNVQLTDVQQSTIKDNKDNYIVEELKPTQYGITYTSDWHDEGKVNQLKAAAAAKGFAYTLDAYDYTATLDALTDSTQFESYVGKFVTCKLTIREGDNNDESPKTGEKREDYFRYGENYNATTDKGTGSLTMFAKTTGGARLNIRSLENITGQQYKHDSFYANDEKEAIGHTWYVIGTIAKYNNTYQICIPNATAIKSGPAYHVTPNPDDPLHPDSRLNGFRWLVS